MSNSHTNEDEKWRQTYIRPFHSAGRDLQQEPDADEPQASSYTDTPFLLDDFGVAPLASQKNKHKTRSSRSANKLKNNSSVRGKCPGYTTSRSNGSLKTEDDTTMHRVQSTSSVIVEVNEFDMLPPNNHVAANSSIDFTSGNKKVKSDLSLYQDQRHLLNDSSGGVTVRSGEEESSSSQTELPVYRVTTTTTPLTKREKQIKYKTKRKSHQQAKLEKMKEKSSHERNVVSEYGVGYGGDLDSSEAYRNRSTSSPTTIHTRESSYDIDDYNNDKNKVGMDENLSLTEDLKVKHRFQEFRREQSGKSKPKLILSNLKINARNIPVNEILSLHHVYKLSQSQNNLFSIPPQLVDGHLHGLSTLDLQKCNLSEVPEKWNLESLKRLDLSYNRLQTLNEDIFLGIPNLQWLNAYDNEITTIDISPDSTALKSLQYFNLGFNNLCELPSILPKLKDLTEVIAGSNCLSYIPKEICDMNLKVLDVTPNPLQKPPSQTCELGLEAMRRYYEYLEEASTRLGPEAMRRYNERKEKKSRRINSRKRREKNKGMRVSSNSSHSRNESFGSVCTVESFGGTTADESSQMSSFRESIDSLIDIDSATVEGTFRNDTIRVIFVGRAMAGKTSLIRCLRTNEETHDQVESKSDESTFVQERTIGVDICEWEPSHCDRKLKFCMWDFAGQRVYHGTHELFFSRRSLYILVWDMAASSVGLDYTGINTDNVGFRATSRCDDSALNIDEGKRRSLYRDIDENVQYWIDCIQSSAPGAAIKVVATHADKFVCNGMEREAEKRCLLMKERIAYHEENHKNDIKERLAKHEKGSAEARRLELLLRVRPNIIFCSSEENSVTQVSCTHFQGFEALRSSIVEIASGDLFRGHVGAQLPPKYSVVRKIVRKFTSSNKIPVLPFRDFMTLLEKESHGEIHKEKDEMQICDALHFLTDTGDVCFFHDPQPEDCCDETPLSHYLFLEPRWLVKAIATIMRHDLQLMLREIPEYSDRQRNGNHINTNYPLITSNEAKLLWKANPEMKQVMDGSEDLDGVFTFLEKLLIRFNVLVPIDPSTFQADMQSSIGQNGHSISAPSTFFLPSLLEMEAAEQWDFKKTQSFQTTLCTSWLLFDFIPPGLFERITSGVLRNLYSAIHPISEVQSSNLRLFPRQIHCWKKALLVDIRLSDNYAVTIFAQLVDRDSKECVATSSMGIGMKRLVVSARGPAGRGGWRINEGGYTMVIEVVDRVMGDYSGLAYEKQAVCPKCLFFLPSRSQAQTWQWEVVQSAYQEKSDTLLCGIGHGSDIRLIRGKVDNYSMAEPLCLSLLSRVKDEEEYKKLIQAPLKRSFRSNVLILRRDVDCQVGSGFIADAQNGLILTARHVVEGSGQIFIGVLPTVEEDNVSSLEECSRRAKFRYCAQIIAEDPVYHVDACVLRISMKLQRDMSSEEIIDCQDLQGVVCPFLIDRRRPFFAAENLHELNISTSSPEIGDFVHVMGFDQEKRGYKTIRIDGTNTSLDCVLGRIRSIWSNQNSSTAFTHNLSRDERFGRFIRKEIKIQCDTAHGHSGGPCVNLRGEVIGIATRSDGEHHGDCYIAPASEWRGLLSQATAIIECPPCSFGSMVLIAQWDDKRQTFANVCSGFVANDSFGLIITGGNLQWEDHEDIYIGVAPRGEQKDVSYQEEFEMRAVFRYRAEIYTTIDELGLCILKISTKLEQDINPYDTLKNMVVDIPIPFPVKRKQSFFMKENLRQFSLCTNAVDVGDDVNILGFDSSSIDCGPGCTISVDYRVGRIVRIQSTGIYAQCSSIFGFLGGPCVNVRGEVIGIIVNYSAMNEITGECQIVPIEEWEHFMKRTVERMQKSFNMYSLSQ